MEEKQKRKPNWNPEESLALAALVEDYKHIYWGKLSPTLTSDMKTRVWVEVAQKLCAIGVGAMAHFRAKYRALKGQFLAQAAAPYPKPLSAIAETVSNVVGENNACLGGIEGGIDFSMLQILGSSEQIALKVAITVEQIILFSN